MARRTPNADELEVLRDTFRRSPPVTPKDFRAAAKVAGVSESVARNAWSRGFVGIEPLQVQLARTVAIQQQSAELLKVDTVVKAAVANAYNLQAEMLRLRPVVEKLREDLLTDATTKGLNLPPERSVALLDKLARVHGRVSAVSTRAVELHRLVNNEATSIVGVKKFEPDAPVAIEEARAIKEKLDRAIQREDARLTAGAGDEPTAEHHHVQGASDVGTN